MSTDATNTAAATAAGALTEGQLQAKEEYLAAAKRYYFNSSRHLYTNRETGRLDREMQLKGSGNFIEQLQKQQDFSKLFDETGKPRVPAGGTAQTLDEFIKHDNRTAEFESALNNARDTMPAPRVREQQVAKAEKSVDIGKWMKKVGTRAEEKLSGSFFRQSAVWLGGMFAVEGLFEALVPRKETTIKNGNEIVVEDASAARKRGLIKLAAATGIAGAAALI